MTDVQAECPHCSVSVGPGWKFCKSCGQRVEVDALVDAGSVDRCVSCGAGLGSGDQFCTRCGTTVASPDDRGVQSGSGIRRWSFAAAGGFILVAVVGGSMWLISGQGAEPPPATVASAAPSFADVSLYPRFSAASDAAEEAMSPSTPGDLELPEVDPEEAGSVAGKLNGDGASLIEFFVAAEGLWDQAPLKEDVCESARERFEAIASPPDLVSAASDLDDIPASDVLGSLVSITALVVSDCGADEANVSEMAWHWAVAYRRLAELGVEIP